MKKKNNKKSKILLTAITSATLIGVQSEYVFVNNALANPYYGENADNISGNIGEDSPWEYKKYEYGRREKPFNTPKLTVTYNDNGTVTVKARYNPKNEYWGGRPFYGITVPKGFEMPKYIYRQVFGKDNSQEPKVKIDVNYWRTGSRFVGLANDDSLNTEWSNRVETNFGYDGTPEEIGFLKDKFKENTQALFLSWEKSGSHAIEFEYTTRVIDRNAENNILASMAQSVNRYSRHGGVYATEKPKPEPKRTKAETYNFKYPQPTLVDNSETLTQENINEVIRKIKEANNGIESIANVTYNSTNKEFVVTFNEDSSTIKLNQKDVVYTEREEVLDGVLSGIKLPEKVLVPKGTYDAIHQNDTNGSNPHPNFLARTEAIARILKINGVSNAPVSPNDISMNGYGSFLLNGNVNKLLSSHYDSPDGSLTNKGYEGTRNPTLFHITKNNKTYYFTPYSAANKPEGLRVYELVSQSGRPQVNSIAGEAFIPYSKIFKYENQQSESNNAPEENRNKKQLDLDKERAKKIVENLNYLTPDRVNAIKQEIDNIVVNETTPYETAKNNLDEKIKNALKENLEAAKTKIKEKVSALENPITDNGENDIFKPEEVKRQIEAIVSDNLTQEDHDSKIAEVEKILKKAEIDSAREKAIKEILASTLPTEKKNELIDNIKNNAPDGEGGDKDNKALDEVNKAKEEVRKNKDQNDANGMKDNAKAEIAKILEGDQDKINELNGKIDNAKSPDEINSIIEEAKAHKKKAEALANIEKLEYLNQAQKDAFKKYINDSAAVEDIDGYVKEAVELDAKMKALNDEVNKSKDIKDNNKPPYSTAGNTTKTPFDEKFEKAKEVVRRDNADSSVNLDGYAVDALLKELKEARLNLRPDNENQKSAEELARAEAEELKADIRKKHKEVKDYIKNNLNDTNNDYVNADKLGASNNEDDLGSIVSEAESGIDIEIAKLRNNPSEETIESVRIAINKIKEDAEKQLEKEKLKAHIDKLQANINSAPDKTDKTQDSITAYEAEKAKAQNVLNEATTLYNNDNADLSSILAEIEKVKQADDALTAKENLEDNVNVNGLNAKIAELDALINKARPTKFVPADKKEAVDSAKTEANTSLESAREVARKQKPTKEEVDEKIAELTKKINNLKEKQNAEKEAVKTKVADVLEKLLPAKDGVADSKLQPLLDRLNKLTNDSLEDSDKDKDTITTNPNTFVESVVNDAVEEAMSNFNNLNNNQKTAKNNELKAEIAKIAENNSTSDKVSEKIAEIKVLDDAMLNLNNLKTKADKIKEQVRYIKEKTEKEKTEFDNAVSAIEAVINKDSGENKSKNDIDTLVNNFNTALGKLDGKVEGLTDENKVEVADLNNLTDTEKEAIVAKIKEVNNDIVNKFTLTKDNVSNTGEVTINYTDGYSQGGVTVENTPTTTLQPSEVLRSSFKNPVKTIADLDGNGNLTDSDKEKIKDAIIAANPKLTTGKNPKFTKDNITVNDDGSVSIVIAGEDEPKTLTADEVVDKTKKKTTKDAMKKSADEAKAKIDSYEHLSDEKKKELKETIDKKLEIESAYINTKHTDFTNKNTDEEKTAEYEKVKKQIDTAKQNYEIEIKKLIAKADVENKAEKIKKEIDALTNLSSEEKEAQKVRIDKEAKAGKDAIDAVDSVVTNELTADKISDNILKEVAKAHAKLELEKKATEVKDKINSLENLSDTEKNKFKEAVDTTLEEEKGKVNVIDTTGDLETAVQKITEAENKGKAELEKDKAKAEIEDKANEVKKAIDELKNLDTDEKDKLKAEVDKTKEAEKEKIENIEPTGNTEEDKAKITEAENKGKAELEKDKAKAEIIDRTNEVKEIINEAKNLTEKEKEDLKKAIDAKKDSAIKKIEDLELTGNKETDNQNIKNTLDEEKEKLIISEVPKNAPFVEEKPIYVIPSDNNQEPTSPKPPKENNKNSNKTLAKTGETTTNSTIAGLGILGLILAFVTRRKKNK